ncbi:MAG TPA: hypothetical protein VE983_13520, partial [Solirubrobacteraceae bacterium]|nr:hypothetical protein [Solirubrobacteraceae bacterium]
SASWRWGGPDWEARSVGLTLAGATVELPEPGAAATRWEDVLGEIPDWIGISLREGMRGLSEIVIQGLEDEFQLAGVRFAPSDYEEE